MLKDDSQLKLSLSSYQGIYDAIISANHLLRRMKENIDFSFVNPMLRKQYCENLGRPSKEPEMMFKLLFLKIRSKDDKDVRFGHKTADSTFNGYKNHIAMTEDRLIAGNLFRN